jgi:hypothetical protein
MGKFRFAAFVMAMFILGISAGRLAYQWWQNSVVVRNAEADVRRSLIEPDSATFRDIRIVRHGTGQAVCGQVNARDQFGAHAGFSDFVWAEGVGSMIRGIEPNGADRYQKLWAEWCRTG